jgi:hypothetical protein
MVRPSPLPSLEPRLWPCFLLSLLLVVSSRVVHFVFWSLICCLGRTQIQISLEFLDLDTVQQARSNVLPIAIVNLKEENYSYEAIFSKEFQQNLLTDIIPFDGHKVKNEWVLVADKKGVWDMTEDEEGKSYGWSKPTKLGEPEVSQSGPKKFCHYCDACPSQATDFKRPILSSTCFPFLITFPETTVFCPSNQNRIF